MMFILLFGGAVIGASLDFLGLGRRVDLGSRA